MTDIGPGEYWAATIWRGRAPGQPTTSGRAETRIGPPDLLSVRECRPVSEATDVFVLVPVRAYVNRVTVTAEPDLPLHRVGVAVGERDELDASFGNRTADELIDEGAPTVAEIEVVSGDHLLRP